MSKTSFVFNFFSALLAFVIWGGWAFFINDARGLESQIQAGLIQGSASFVITIIMLKILIYVRTMFLPVRLPKYLPGVITVAITGTGLVLLHLISQTPNILHTVTPPLIVALVFCLFTCHKLSTQELVTLKEGAQIDG